QMPSRCQSLLGCLLHLQCLGLDAFDGLASLSSKPAIATRSERKRCNFIDLGFPENRLNGLGGRGTQCSLPLPSTRQKHCSRTTRPVEMDLGIGTHLTPSRICSSGYANLASVIIIAPSMRNAAIGDKT